MCLPTDLDTLFAGLRACWVYCARGGRLDDLTAQSAGEADPRALDDRAGVGEHLQRRGVVADLDPDLLEDRVGVVLEQLDAPRRRSPRTAAAREVRNGWRSITCSPARPDARSVPLCDVLGHHEAPCCSID